MPGVYGLSSYMPEPLDQRADRMEQTVNADVGYLLLDEPPYGPQYGPDPGVSQYMRRCIAMKLGIPDEWDYLLFPRLENVTETARAISGRFTRVSIAEHDVT
jgi:hypothetical protein